MSLKAAIQSLLTPEIMAQSARWTREHSEAAEPKGWSLFSLDSTGVLEIQKVDEQDVFLGDAAAKEFVRGEAGKGDPVAALAVEIHDAMAPVAKFFHVKPNDEKWFSLDELETMDADQVHAMSERGDRVELIVPPAERARLESAYMRFVSEAEPELVETFPVPDAMSSWDMYATIRVNGAALDEEQGYTP